MAHRLRLWVMVVKSSWRVNDLTASFRLNPVSWRGVVESCPQIRIHLSIRFQKLKKARARSRKRMISLCSVRQCEFLRENATQLERIGSLDTHDVGIEIIPAPSIQRDVIREIICGIYGSPVRCGLFCCSIRILPGNDPGRCA